MRTSHTAALERLIDEIVKDAYGTLCHQISEQTAEIVAFKAALTEAKLDNKRLETAREDLCTTIGRLRVEIENLKDIRDGQVKVIDEQRLELKTVKRINSINSNQARIIREGYEAEDQRPLSFRLAVQKAINQELNDLFDAGPTTGERLDELTDAIKDYLHRADNKLDLQDALDKAIR